MKNDLRINQLDSVGQQLAQLIISTAENIQKRPVYCGGCRAFYSPQEWQDRQELYGLDSHLIVCHDGGDFASFFNYAYEVPDYMEKMRQAIKKFGYYAVSCTSWYTAIYPDR